MLRDYQTRLYDETLAATFSLIMRTYLGDDGCPVSFEERVRSILIQLCTGAGKTPLSSAIIKSAYLKGRRVWFMVPRNELLRQGSAHLTKWGVPHATIEAGREESRAFKVHCVSKDTLLKRLERIKDWPDLLIIDECHIAIDAQLKIITAANLRRTELGLAPMIVIGQTATPERLDGRGLWSGAGGPYDVMVQGPSIPWLTEGKYLAPLRYYAPPIEGLDKLHWSKGEIDASELDALLKAKKIYGKVVEYYKKYGTNPDGTMKPALGFCRSVLAAEETAAEFRAAGFRFMSIDGKMSTKERKALIDGLRDGTLDGLTSCELTTYGLDVPRVEYGFSIRPTQSRALYFQMVGRILRPYIKMRCQECGAEYEGFVIECQRCHRQGLEVVYEKQDAYFFDHVNMILEHQDPRYPGIPLFKIDNIDWNFKGVTRRARAKADPSALRLCPHLDYQYCDKPSCLGCMLKKPGEDDARRAGLPVVDATLEERKGPTHFADLMPEEKRDVQDRIGRATEAALASEGVIDAGPIGELLAVAAELGRSPMWVYHWLTEKENARRREQGKGDRLTVNAPLIHEIARQKRYAPGWCWFKIKEIREGKKEEAVV